jgi:predicted DNA-binding transcriptional regulator YafY
MDKFEKLYQLHNLFETRRYPVSIQTISEHLGCSSKTTYRLLNVLRDTYHAPVTEDAHKNRFYDLNHADTFELPGLWFSNEELHALLAAHQYLSLTEPGLIEPTIKPLRMRIETILSKHHQHPGAALQRIRLLGIGMRHSDQQYFRHIASAVLARKQLHIHYTRRSDGNASKRDVSPQRLSHYRDNWYLDAWCHLKNELRTFALDQITQCNTLDIGAREIDTATLDQHYASAYGIFAGEANKIAILKFNAKRARWIEKEQWHPQQTGEWKNDYYLLSIPYNNPTELIMDILKYGADVEVLALDELRAAVQIQISDMHALYD